MYIMQKIKKNIIFIFCSLHHIIVVKVYAWSTMSSISHKS